MLRTVTMALRLAVIGGLAGVLVTCVPPLSLGEQLETLGTLRVATVNSATTYYLDADGPAGFEYDLVRGFADSLGLALDVVVVDNRATTIEAVNSGRAHMAVGLAISEHRRAQVRLTPSYATIVLEAVYHSDAEKPETLEDLDGRLTLPAHTALNARLARIHRELRFTTAANTNAEELMAKVAEGALYSTIANADLVAMNQRYHPQLRVAFELPEVKRRLAWAFAERSGDSLYNKAIAYLEKTKSTGRMRILRDRYYGHAERLGFVGGMTFASQVEQRLPRWRDLFKRAGDDYDLDWRLLAAMGYQESHWDEDAVSPTNVRGIMMLTRPTARGLGVSNRRDPAQSIDGGARYFKQQRQRLPEEITEPDRTWMAMAAYNIGYGHLMDARRLLEARGRDPNLWINVREALPWLTQERYLDETRYGYAPGKQAVAYVGNIRAYYDVLVWMTSDEPVDKPTALAREESEAGAAQAPISIDSPAL